MFIVHIKMLHKYKMGSSRNTVSQKRETFSTTFMSLWNIKLRSLFDRCSLLIYFNEAHIFITGRVAAQANKIHANASLVDYSVLEHS